MRVHPTKAAPVATTLLMAGLWLAVTACRPPAPPPSENGTTGSETTTGTPVVGTTFSEPLGCEGSDDCDEDLRCVAAYDPGSDPPRGPGACVQVCIEQDDLTRWCFDDAGCCGELRCREVDGFCEPAPGSEESSSDGGSSSSGGTSSGGSSSSSGGSSSSSGGTSSSSSSSGGGSSSTG